MEKVWTITYEFQGEQFSVTTKPVTYEVALGSFNSLNCHGEGSLKLVSIQ